MEIVTESNDLSTKSNKEGNENLDNGLSHDAPILDFTQNISESVSSLNGNYFDILETGVVLEKMHTISIPYSQTHCLLTSEPHHGSPSEGRWGF